MGDLSTRRAFLGQAALGGWALGTAFSPLSEESLLAAPQETQEPRVATADSIPIVDTHLHLWDLEKFDLPWTKGAPALNRSFVMSDYLAATKGLNLAKAVYMEVDVTPAQQVREAEYVIDICQRGDTPMVAAVISGRPADPKFKDYVARFAGNKFIKGIRQVLHGEETPPGYCLQPQFVKGIQLLGEEGLSFDLCMRSSEMADAVKLVKQCPKTRFILDHCGNLDVHSTDEKLRKSWEQGLKELAQNERLVCKISGIVASARKGWKPEDLAPVAGYAMETFGPDRRMFGGDWPVCTLGATYAEWVGALRQIVKEMSAPDQKKLFHDNAVRFYGLK